MLKEQQRDLRSLARRFAERELLPGAAQRDRERRFPRQAFAGLAELGLMGMLVPAQLGGMEADHVAYVLAIIEVAAADGAASTALQVHNGLVCGSLCRFGTEDQQQRFLRPLAEGRLLGAFCLTEPDAGSDAAALKTQARREGGKFVLNGTKHFITSGGTADLVIAFAVTAPDAPKHRVAAFVVPTATPGYVVSQVQHTMGQRSGDHCEIRFENCEVPADQLLGSEGQGLEIAFASLELGRLGIAAQSVGMARAALDAALGFAKRRHTFGRPIIEHQAIGFRLADMATSLKAAELMVLHAARLRDEGRPAQQEIAMAKLFATEAAEEICNAAIQIHGGYGYLEDFPVERIYRDVRVCKIYEGTSEIQRLVINRRLMSEPNYSSIGE
ncbi:acyl-CoA dehydrogenase family protein [Bradyrhizobium liaoningense]|uniref:acyl-CoA dehydrogenase family protein n=1 Tax=Bradyrhizobium liaoningense TaxID=43992 RepID=UPI00289C1F38|nr:acyl-CoA dehydrogenase family protein [Bradyrhizobium liaoningense]